MKDAAFPPDRPSGRTRVPVPVERIAPTGARDARGPDAPRRRPRPAVSGAGRGRRPRGAVRHRRRPGGLRADIAQWRSRPERPARPLAAGRPHHDRPRRDPARPASGAGMGRPDRPERPARRAVRSHQLRPHRVHRHEPLDRPGDRDLRHHPDQPAASRRPGPIAHGAAVRGRHAGRGGDRGCLAPASQWHRHPAQGARASPPRRGPCHALRHRRPGGAGFPPAPQQAGRSGHQSHRPDARRGLDDRRALRGRPR